MSAYGAIQKPHQEDISLPTTTWLLNLKAPSNNVSGSQSYVTVHHLTLVLAEALPGLLEYLASVFAKEVEDGMTYPQEGPMDIQMFKAYFFSGDVFVAISINSDPKTHIYHESESQTPSDGAESELSITGARGERTWNDSIAGFYYVRLFVVIFRLFFKPHSLNAAD
jgi:hypothetical protein